MGFWDGVGTGLAFACGGAIVEVWIKPHIKSLRRKAKKHTKKLYNTIRW